MSVSVSQRPERLTSNYGPRVNSEPRTFPSCCMHSFFTSCPRSSLVKENPPILLPHPPLYSVGSKEQVCFLNTAEGSGSRVE
ncbi:hypothetical protein EYF80_010507 [Liparis tanakae]|uniref:Uncharacterized protein n=1 Tax=Liparis tanakae TaxID=230148 RepID=A0A4Z2IPX6_9TELE|nr:hypothetical protein EYF80_010507 [Liparis tanakae]